jgi:hypothetical protein
MLGDLHPQAAESSNAATPPAADTDMSVASGMGTGTSDPGASGAAAYPSVPDNSTGPSSTAAARAAIGADPMPDLTSQFLLTTADAEAPPKSSGVSASTVGDSMSASTAPSTINAQPAHAEALTSPRS